MAEDDDEVLRYGCAQEQSDWLEAGVYEGLARVTVYQRDRARHLSGDPLDNCHTVLLTHEDAELLIEKLRRVIAGPLGKLALDAEAKEEQGDG